MKLSKGVAISLFVTGLLIIDQIIKIVVKLNMAIGDSIYVFGQEWFQICFTENSGFAFGLKFGGDFGKIFLTLFRIALIAFIIFFIKKRLLKEKEVSTGLLVGISLVLVGAIGNVIDCIFYGQLFSESTWFDTATFLPEGGGYAPLLMGKVVDMFYFPIIDTTLPEWVPFRGGERFVFFRAIFNFADACISVGGIYLLLFQRKNLFKYFDK